MFGHLLRGGHVTLHPGQDVVGPRGVGEALFQCRGHTRIAAGFGQQLMEPLGAMHGSDGVRGGQVILLVQLLPKFGYQLPGGQAGCRGGGEGLKQHPHVQGFVDIGEADPADQIPLLGQDLQQSFAGELAQGFTYRGLGNPEFLGQPRLNHHGARGQLAAEHPPAQFAG